MRLRVYYDNLDAGHVLIGRGLCGGCGGVCDLTGGVTLVLKNDTLDFVRIRSQGVRTRMAFGHVKSHVTSCFYWHLQHGQSISRSKPSRMS